MGSQSILADAKRAFWSSFGILFLITYTAGLSRADQVPNDSAGLGNAFISIPDQPSICYVYTTTYLATVTLDSSSETVIG